MCVGIWAKTWGRFFSADMTIQDLKKQTTSLPRYCRQIMSWGPERPRTTPRPNFSPCPCIAGTKRFIHGALQLQGRNAQRIWSIWTRSHHTSGPYWSIWPDMARRCDENDYPPFSVVFPNFHTVKSGLWRFDPLRTVENRFSPLRIVMIRCELPEFDDRSRRVFKNWCKSKLWATFRSQFSYGTPFKVWPDMARRCDENDYPPPLNVGFDWAGNFYLPNHSWRVLWPFNIEWGWGVGGGGQNRSHHTYGPDLKWWPTYLQVILSSILLNDIRGKVQSQQGKAFPATGNMHAIRSSAFIITIHTYGTESQYGPVSQKVTDFSLLVSDVHLQSMISSLPFNNPTIKDGEKSAPMKVRLFTLPAVYKFI